MKPENARERGELLFLYVKNMGYSLRKTHIPGHVAVRNNECFVICEQKRLLQFSPRFLDSAPCISFIVSKSPKIRGIIKTRIRR